MEFAKTRTACGFQLKQPFIPPQGPRDPCWTVAPTKCRPNGWRRRRRLGRRLERRRYGRRRGGRRRRIPGVGGEGKKSGENAWYVSIHAPYVDLKLKFCDSVSERLVNPEFFLIHFVLQILFQAIPRHYIPSPRNDALTPKESQICHRGSVKSFGI